MDIRILFVFVLEILFIARALIDEKDFIVITSIRRTYSVTEQITMKNYRTIIFTFSFCFEIINLSSMQFATDLRLRMFARSKLLCFKIIYQ